MRITNIALIQAAVLAAMAPVMSNVQTVSADDYSIELTIDTMEIPINYIESNNRIAYIPIKVSNNPGIEYLSFVVEKDERITEDAGVVSYPDFPFGVELQSMTNTNDRYIGVTAGYGFGDYYYDTDGLFCAIRVVLPENCSVGDYYSFNFYADEAGSQRQVKFEKDGIEYGKECFSYVNGGIKIVEAVSYGHTPETPTPTQPEAPVNNNQDSQNPQGNPQVNPQDNAQDNLQQVQNQNNNINDNNDNNNNTHYDINSPGSLTAKDSVSTAVTSTAVSGTTVVSSAAKASSQKNVSKTTVTKVSTEKSTAKQPITETDQTDTVATVAQTKKSKGYTKIVIAVVSALVLLAIGGAAVIIKKKNNRKGVK